MDNRGFNNQEVSFGEIGLVAVGRGRLNARQIEAARRTISRQVKKGGKLWIRVFPDKPITKKPLEVRQGKGKGAVEFFVSEIKPGTMIFEVEGVSEDIITKAFHNAAAKLPFKVRVVKRKIGVDMSDKVDYKSQAIADLRNELVTLRRRRLDLRVKVQLGQEIKIHEFSVIRKTIARIKTAINDKVKQGN